MEKEKVNYYREKPIREIKVKETIYNNVIELNKRNMKYDAIEFLGNKFTYEELIENVDKLASAYSKSGIKEGDSIGILSITMPTVQENLLACSKLGATAVWLDLRTKEKDLIKKINEMECKKLVVFEELTHLIEKVIGETDVNEVLIVSPKDYLSPIVKVFANIKDYKEGKKIKLPNDKRFKYYREFIKTGDANEILKPATFEFDRPSIIVQSSGSTGVSKSIVHTEFNFNEAMRKESYSDLPLICGNTMHISIPPFIIYGLNSSVYAALTFGLKALMTPFLTDDTVFRDLGKFDMSCGVPLQYRWIYNKIITMQAEIEKLEKEDNNTSKKELSRLLKELNSIFDKLKHTSVLITGGDKVTCDEILSWQHLFGTSVINGYGNNEVVGAAVITPVFASKPNSIGIPMKDITISAFDPETNEKLPDGKEGELCIYLNNAFIKYVNNEEETNEIKQLHSDGKMWVHTGDLGYVDEDGYVYVIGRSKRLIKSSAFKIAPISIEKILLTIPEIKDCVVVGVPDDELKEVPMAFIELKESYENQFDMLKEKILEKLGEELPDYEIPKYMIERKIPYKNGKQAFAQLEEEGIKYVESLDKGMKLIKK